MVLDPVSRAIANAPIDVETETAEERQAVADADEWLKHNTTIPFEDVLAVKLPDSRSRGRIWTRHAYAMAGS